MSATNVSQFARAMKRHEQQCFGNNVSSFASTFTGGLLVFTFLRGKSSELAALVTLLARLPVNYRQLS